MKILISPFTKNKFLISVSFISFFFFNSFMGDAQSVDHMIRLMKWDVIDFNQLADALIDSFPLKNYDSEQDENLSTPPFNKLNPALNANCFQFDLSKGTYANQVQSASPAPAANFIGIKSNGSPHPPDISGAAGLSYLMETTNQQFSIFSKAGILIKTLSIAAFFSSTHSTGLFDPRIVYDRIYDRFIISMDGYVSNGNMGITLAVSQTGDPTGNWYLYSFDGTGNPNDLLDFPQLGFNANWIVITADDYGVSYAGKIFTLNRADLYNGSLGTVHSFSDAGIFSLAPAQTCDSGQAVEYLIQEYNGNSSGKGYVQLATLSGTADAPVYTLGAFLSVNQAWDYNGISVPQANGSTPLDADASVIGAGAVFRNGSLWFCHTVFLPAGAPSHTGCDWWQIDPVNIVVQQFGRVADNSGNVFYFYPSINVNSRGDALLSYCQSSANTYVSCTYSFHAANDSPNSMEDNYLFRSGVGNFAVLVRGDNRWGDYTAVALDPSDNSFWTFSQWADSNNRWSTAIANVLASGVSGFPLLLQASNIQLYPNPNNGLFTLSFNARNEENYNIEISNILGQIIYSEKLNGLSGAFTRQIDMKDHGSGIYFVSFKTPQSEVVKKVIVY